MKIKLIISFCVCIFSLLGQEIAVVKNPENLDNIENYNDEEVIKGFEEARSFLKNYVDEHHIGVDLDSPSFFGFYVSGGLSRKKIKLKKLSRDITKLYTFEESKEKNWHLISSKAKIALPPVFTLPISSFSASVTAGISKGWIGNFKWVLFGKDYRVFSKNIAQASLMPYLFKEMPINQYMSFPDSYKMIMKVATGSEFNKNVRSFLHAQLRVKIGTFWGLQRGLTYLQWGDFNYHIHVLDKNGIWPIIRAEVENSNGSENKLLQGLFAGIEFFESFAIDGSIVNNLVTYSQIEEKRNSVKFSFLYDFSYVHARKAYQKMLKGDVAYSQKYGISRFQFPDKYRGIFIEEESNSNITMLSHERNFLKSKIKLGVLSSVINSYAPISFINKIFDLGSKKTDLKKKEVILKPDSYHVLRDSYGVQENDNSLILWGSIRRNHIRNSINYVWERVSYPENESFVLDEKLYLDYSFQDSENWKLEKRIQSLYSDVIYAYSGDRYSTLEIAKILGSNCSRDLTFNLNGTIQTRYLEEIGSLKEEQLWNYLGQFFRFKDPEILETSEGRNQVLSEHPYGPARHKVRYYYKYPLTRREIKLFHKFYRYKGIGGIAFAVKTLLNDYRSQAEYLGSLLQKGSANLKFVEFLHYILRKRLPLNNRPSINLSLSSRNCILSFDGKKIRKIIPN